MRRASLQLIKRRFINIKQQFFEGKFKFCLRRFATDGVARAEFKVCLNEMPSRVGRRQQSNPLLYFAEISIPRER
ncbi:MAG: hypothetical protein SPE53_07215 [Prevotella sp.]|nr:hypothetical protein [Prevotella sp.]